MKWLVCIAILGAPIEAKKQTVSVNGIAFCGENSIKDVVVELWDKDAMSPDDLMATVTTDVEGAFNITGSLEEWSDIKPYVVFKHKCKVNDENCTRHTRYSVPEKYINSKETYDMIHLVLDIHGNKDKKVC